MDKLSMDKQNMCNFWDCPPLESVFTLDVLNRLNDIYSFDSFLYQGNYNALCQMRSKLCSCLELFMFDGDCCSEFMHSYCDDRDTFRGTKKMVEEYCVKLEQLGIDFPELFLVEFIPFRFYRGSFYDGNSRITHWIQLHGSEVVGNILREVSKMHELYGNYLYELDEVFESNSPYDAVCELFGVGFVF